MTSRQRRTPLIARWLVLVMLWQALVGVAAHQHDHLATGPGGVPASATVLEAAGAVVSASDDALVGQRDGRLDVSLDGDEDGHAAERCAWCLAQADLAHPQTASSAAAPADATSVVLVAVEWPPASPARWAPLARGPPVA